MLIMVCYLGIVHVQEQGQGGQPAPTGNQAGEMPGQERMGERGRMT